MKANDVWVFSIAIQNESIASVVYFEKNPNPAKLSDKKQSQFTLSSIADFAKMTVIETKQMMSSNNDDAIQLMTKFISR